MVNTNLKYTMTTVTKTAMMPNASKYIIKEEAEAIYRLCT